MIVQTEARSATPGPLHGVDLSKVAMALVIVAVLGVAIGLAIIGLDALNDLLARGFATLRTPSG